VPTKTLFSYHTNTTSTTHANENPLLLSYKHHFHPGTLQIYRKTIKT